MVAWRTSTHLRQRCVKRPRCDAASLWVEEDVTMPRKIDPKVKERCVQQMLEHVAGH